MFAPRTEHIYKHWAKGEGGGGYSDNILYKGVLGAGTAQKMGVLVADTTRKRGGGVLVVLGAATSRK